MAWNSFWGCHGFTRDSCNKVTYTRIVRYPWLSIDNLPAWTQQAFQLKDASLSVRLQARDELAVQEAEAG
jgi:hypothetical protein